MKLEDRIRTHMHAAPEVELGAGVDDIMAAGARRHRNQIGGTIAAGLIGIAAVIGLASLAGDPAEVETIDETPAEIVDIEETSIGPWPTELPFEASVVGTPSGFAALGIGPDGTVSTTQSADGLTWTETTSNGLPTGNLMPFSFLFGRDGSYVAFLFDNGAGPTLDGLHVATSDDFVTWESSEVPLSVRAGSTVSGVSYATIEDGQVLAFINVVSAGIDPLIRLLESQALSPDEFSGLCGWDAQGPDAPIVLFGCGTETDDAQIAVGELLPGEPGHAEFFEALNARPINGPQLRALRGPVGGPYEVSVVDAATYADNIVATENGFSMIAFDEEGQARFTSPDGAQWTREETLGQLRGPVVATPSGIQLGVSQTSDGITIARSDDGGTTWEMSTVTPERAAREGFGEGTTGSAGTAILLHGTTNISSEIVWTVLFSDDDGVMWRELPLPDDRPLEAAEILGVGDDEVLIRAIPSFASDALPGSAPSAYELIRLPLGVAVE